MNYYSELVWLVPMKDGSLKMYDSKDGAISAARIFKADGRATGKVYSDTVRCYMRSTPAAWVLDDGTVWNKPR